MFSLKVVHASFVTSAFRGRQRVRCQAIARVQIKSLANRPVDPERFFGVRMRDFVRLLTSPVIYEDVTLLPFHPFPYMQGEIILKDRKIAALL